MVGLQYIYVVKVLVAIHTLKIESDRELFFA